MGSNLKIETNTVIIEIKNNIIYIVIKDDADMDLEAIKEAVEARRKLQKGKPMLALVDNRKMWQLTKEANKYSSTSSVGKLSKAMAILTNSSLATRIMANFFIRLNKKNAPTKLFISEKKAVKWLQSIKS